MAEDGKVVYKVSVDSSDAENEAERAGEKIGASLGSKIGTAFKAAGAGVAAVGAATAAGAAALVKATGDVASYGDNIDKMSQKMGLSIEAYQEWDAIMQHSGTSIEAMQASMKTLASAAETGSKAFDQLGISQEELQSMSQEELFSATISALQKVDDETERTYLAGQLLGRGATELGALLNTSAEDTEAMRQRVHELGGVMSEDAVKASAKYQDSLQDMQTAFSGLSRSMLTEFLPGITTVMDGLTEIFSGNTDEGLGLVTDGIQQVIDGISEKLPEFLDAGAQIINALLTAIIQNLPQLLTGAAGMVMQIATGLLQNLPQIIEAGLEVIIALTNGIADNLDELLPVIVDVVITIVEALIENAPKMIEAAAKLIGKLIEGIGLMFAELITKAGEIVGKIVEGIKNKFSDVVNSGKQIIDKVKEGVTGAIESAKQWGKDLIQNFIDGILGMWESLKATVGKVAGVIGDFLGFSEPDEGPLSNFHTFAPDMMKLYAQGIHDNRDLVLKEVDALASMMNFSPEITGRGTFERNVSYKLAATGTTAARQIVVPVNLNGREIARATAVQMGEQLAWEEMQ